MANISSLERHNRGVTRDDIDVIIGPDILELLSSGMYVDPITIYREYIQNSADAIDKARDDGVLTCDQLGQVDISVDSRARSVCIRDNGCGIPAENFARRLLAIGGSEKRGTSARGFRGVGRLAGLAYAQEVLFLSSSAGETVTSKLCWDCRALKAALLRLDNIASVADVIRSVTSFEEEVGTDIDEHFFEVRLKGVMRLNRNQLTNPVAVSKYLSQVAPVPFSPNFRFRDEITTAVSKHMNIGTLIIRINGENDPIFRPHRDQVACGATRQVNFKSVDVVELPGIDGNVAAVAWVLHHEYEGALLAETMVKGLRLRSGNIQVGDDFILESLFTESRFNSWSVGEVHVLDSRITPNSRRDHFEQDAHYSNLLNHLLPTVREISRICRVSSAQRRWERSFEVNSRVADGKIAILEQGSVGTAERSRIRLEVEEVLAKMHDICENKIRREATSDRDRRLVVLRDRLSSIVEKTTIDASPLMRLSANDRLIYERIFELIYQCSASHVTAKSLIDRILMRIT